MSRHGTTGMQPGAGRPQVQVFDTDTPFGRAALLAFKLKRRLLRGRTWPDMALESVRGFIDGWRR